MSKKYLIPALCALATTSALADPEIYAMQRAKSDKIYVTKSAGHIDFTPVKNYDKYIISVSGPNNFYHSFETDSPFLDINDLELEFDGTFNYEIQAVNYLVEVKDTINNGRDENTRGYISKIDVASGSFTTDSFAIKIFEQETEKPKKPIKLPKVEH